MKVIEWDNIPHETNFFSSNLCPTNDGTIELGFLINRDLFVSDHLMEESTIYVSTLSHYISILASTYADLPNHLNESVYYAYCVSMMTYYMYINNQKVNIDSETNKFILKQIALYADQGSVYDDVLKFLKSINSYHLLSEDDFNSNDAGTLNLMKCESMLMFYGNNESIFNFFKGCFLAKSISFIYCKPTGKGNLKSDIIAHSLRNKHITQKQGHFWKYAVYNNRWEPTTSNTAIIGSMSVIGNYLRKYINLPLLKLLDITEDIHSNNLEILEKCCDQGNVKDFVREKLLANEYIATSKSYNKTLRFKNQVYDLNNGELRNPRPHDIHQFSIGYDFYGTMNPEIESELDDLIRTYFPDPDIEDYIYQIFGRMLSGNVSDKSLWIFLGDTNTGKSKFMELVSIAFGQYADILTGNYLNKKSRGSDATTSINKVVGKLLGIVQEPQNGNIDVEAIKELTGDSYINVRELYHEATTIKNTIRYVICANDISINSYDAALWMRVHVVQFTTKFVDAEYYEQIKDTPESVNFRVSNQNIDSIFKRIAPALMLRFIKAYHKTEGKSMHHPSIINDYTRMFRDEHDVTASFFNSHYSKEVNSEAFDFMQVYAEFQTWYSNTQGQFKNYITEKKLKDAARSNGFVVTEDKLINVTRIKQKLAITNFQVNSSIGNCLLPDRPYFSSGEID